MAWARARSGTDGAVVEEIAVHAVRGSGVRRVLCPRGRHSLPVDVALSGMRSPR
jgi:hypothetical protein